MRLLGQVLVSPRRSCRLHALRHRVIIPNLTLHASVRNDFWRQALALAQRYFATLRDSHGFSQDFDVCVWMR